MLQRISEMSSSIRMVTLALVLGHFFLELMWNDAMPSDAVISREWAYLMTLMHSRIQP